MTRWSVLLALLLAGPVAAAPPNVVVFFADDLAYADVGCFGKPKWKTPHIDSLARDGVRLTNFYVAQPVCSASRCALLTGCYPNRLGFHGALGPKADHGLHADETTIAEALKEKGYATAIVGKWHLGHRPPCLPLRHGFDEWLGLPYSNDMWPRHPESPTQWPPLPLFDGDKVIDPDVSPTVADALPERYADRAVSFVKRNKNRPFFLYCAFNMPHVPLAVGDKFRGKSGAGTFGDVIEQIDDTVGRVLAELDAHGLRDNTLVVFTSDNGPWLSYGDHAGTAGPLREGKGTCFEGGVRVPFVARLPKVFPAGATVETPAMTIDLLPTIAQLTGATLGPRPIDGKDIGAILRNEPEAKSPHAAYFFYYNVNELHAVRAGKWKLTLPHTARTMTGQPPGGGGLPGKYKPLPVGQALYDLVADVGETTDVSAANPDVVKEMLAHAERARADLGDALTKRVGSGVREPGRVK